MNPPDRIILPKSMQATITEYETAHTRYIELAAEVRRLTKVVEEKRSIILDKMGKYFLAKCQNYLIVRTVGNSYPATITLANARVITPSEISSITLKDGTRIAGDQIVKLYSGRNEGDKIAISK